MHSLLQPGGTVDPLRASTTVVALLVASAALVVAAALAMPAPYAWHVHSISESAAQGLQHAWIARLGFLSFGAAVLILALMCSRHWGRAAFWSHIAFAGLMLATAAFSHKPWLPGVPSDATEDLFHSITATAMGFAFALGVAARLFERGRNPHWPRALDAVALLAAMLLSPVGTLSPGIGGLLQRVMFGVAYLWYASEAIAYVMHSRRTGA